MLLVSVWYRCQLAYCFTLSLTMPPSCCLMFSYSHFNVFAVKYLEFLRKRMNTNPSRGPYHFRAPSKIFYRTVRGNDEDTKLVVAWYW